MRTYQDKQQVADLVYAKKDPITIGTETWTRIDELSTGEKEPSSGYYGAVYQGSLIKNILYKSIDVID